MTTKLLFATVFAGAVLACGGSEKTSNTSGASSAAEASQPGDGGDSASGAVDESRLGAACTSDCSAGERCIRYGGLRPGQSTARCVAAENPCELVTCDAGRKCVVKTIHPVLVTCVVE